MQATRPGITAELAIGMFSNRSRPLIAMLFRYFGHNQRKVDMVITEFRDLRLLATNDNFVLEITVVCVFIALFHFPLLRLTLKATPTSE